MRPFFLELVAHCPEEASIDSSLQRELITNLNVVRSYALINLDLLSNLSNLKNLCLGHCTSLTNVDGLSSLTNLEYLNLSNCYMLTNVDGLSNLSNLTELVLGDCDSLTNVDGLKPYQSHGNNSRLRISHGIKS